MSAMPHPATATAAGCHLVSLDGRTLPLTHVRLTGQAGGGLAEVRLEQRFRNPYAEPLTVTYQLPLPADGAVVGFSFSIGERVITGEVDRKAAARERFEQAVLEGKTAAILEQDRSSLFTQEIGNIPAGQTVVAHITVSCPLVWRQGEWQLRFPTVVAPRYLGSQTPDPDRVTVPVADAEVGVKVDVALDIRDALTGPVSSPSHVIELSQSRVQLPIQAQLDRDLVIRWPVAQGEPGVHLEVGRPQGQEHAYGLLTLLPPKVAQTAVPRDLIVLLDTSGSMGGRPLDQARAFIRALITGLTSQDRLELIAFASSREAWSPAARSMDPTARAQAIRWLEKRRASGSTEMHSAMIAALQPLRDEAQRQVILVSDGLIGFERQIINAIRHGLPRASRVHTVGVGSGVNRSLTQPCARAGAGLEIVVGLDEGVEVDVARLLARTGQPQVVDLQLQGSALLGHAPARLPDLFADAPSPISLQLRPSGGQLVVIGRTADGEWRKEIEVAPVESGAGPRSLATRFARESVEDLEIAHAAGDPGIDAQIEALGVQYQIATRMTSWVAMTTEATVDPSDPTRRETMPQALPYGMSAEGVGLRKPHPPSQVSMSSMAPPMPAPAARPSRGRRLRKRGPSPLADLARRSKELVFGSKLPERAVEATMDEEADQELDAVMPGAPPRPTGPSLRLLARVVRHADGVLVLSFTVPHDGWWQAATVVAYWDDASSRSLTVTAPSTRAGDVSAGATVRLAVTLADGSKLPNTIIVTGPQGSLTLQLERP